MERSFDRDFGALEEIFEFTARFMADRQINERLSYSINLIVEELFTNMVKHNTGGGHPIRIRMDVRDGHLRINFVDEDVDPWDPAQAPDVRVDQLIEERKPGGLGLILVRSMADEIEYDYTDRRMSVTVTKKLEP